MSGLHQPEEELIDYEDDHDVTIPTGATGAAAAPADGEKEKKTYTNVHTTGFRDFLLKPELLRAISDLGFEHPSEVQQECIPQAVLGMDVLCQAKSGHGKTAVFVLATLQQLEPVDGEVSVIVLCHTRELAYQIRNEYIRFSRDPPRHEEELIDYEDDHDVTLAAGTTGAAAAPADGEKEKKTDFLLKPELLRAISDLGFEHPSEVQQECIPQAVLGMDVLCQAKSGHGKTAVFVLATLQQLEPVDGEVSVIVLCHTRELAYQIRNEYLRFSRFMPDVRTAVVYGGTPVQKDVDLLKDKTKCPHIIVATPGRLNALARDKHLDPKKVKHFVLDECDKMLEQLG
ncbi:unnamed protein product [Rhizoctonia solani]|uniref:ATP-dependent RNA helicase n=1 Tax=Rhizoctonia solani TaxID=456999 RepID=A0A8H3CM46_9AGAM|nr:unnamed protein product [Rhizoctonia solani]